MTGAYKVHPTKHPSLPPMPCPTFTTSGLVRCVRLGRSPREGSAPLVGVGWTFLRFTLASATLCACCAAGCGNCRGWACFCWRPPRFSTLSHPFPGRSLGSRLLGYQRPLPPHPLSTLVWDYDVAVAAWLAFLHGNLLYLFWVLHNPSSHNWRPCRSTRGLPWSVPLPAGVEEELRAVFGEDMSVD